MTVAFESPESPRLNLSITPSGAQGIEFKAGGWAPVFLLVWLVGWSVGEVLAFSILSGGAAGEQVGFLGIWLLVWTVAGGVVGSLAIWGMFGSEIILVDSLTLQHAYKVFGFVRTRQFQSNLVSHLRWIERRGRRTSHTALEFDYGTRTIRVLRGIDHAEAGKVISLIEDRLGRKGAGTA